ncbi:MAG: hypothetical protein QOF78_561, partial [Phycisphaerales bacterium]|nr:hypothetical protein [Phycisphaerales bacterium]
MERLEPRRLLASPELDLTFGEGGFTGEVPGFFIDFFFVKELANGKILAAGSSGNFGNAPVVARFNADGTPDTTFDSDGLLFIPQGDVSSGRVEDVVMAPDGKILLLHDKDDHLSVYRFMADGAVDTTWGTNGVVRLVPAGLEFPTAATIDLQPDGKIVFTYLAFPGPATAHQFFLNRLNADGSVDNSFRGGLTNPVPIDMWAIEDSAVLPDGKIVLAGTRLPDPGNAAAEDGVVMRFNADGSVDTSFSGDGRADVTASPDSARPFALAVDADGNILANARVIASGRSIGLVERFTPAGAPDTIFGGGDGMVEIDPGVDEGVAPGGLYIGTDGKITGILNDFGQIRLTLFRLNANGTLDTTFDGDGYVQPNAQATSQANVITLDSDGNILVAGWNLAVARFVADSVDVSLNANETLYINGTDGADTIALSHVGNQLVVNRNGTNTSFLFTDVKSLTVRQSAGDDVITVPFALDCHIDGGTGNDSIMLGDGDMFIRGGFGVNRTDDADGDDTVVCGNGDHDIYLGEGDNSATVGAGNSTIGAGNGDNTITTGAGDDTIFTGNGDDAITCGSGDDSIGTAGGNDTVRSGAGNDIIEAGSFASGDKFYDGGAGNDIITGGSGRDTLIGGAQ